MFTIGLSLSFCIQAFLSGRVKHLPGAICAGTFCFTEEQYQEVLNSYKRIYWRKYPKVAERIAWWYWENDMLVQPRVEGFDESFGSNRYEHTKHPLGEWYVDEECFEDFVRASFRSSDIANHETYGGQDVS